ncbi:bifunctional diaminohydroxyphosphoribosylaminopyrimidine deaminase/5-amino-6-(5-phosphoribosylamino)uracil reductase RibD [Amorphus coralli]|uniref:bifunctional diaminohydroxyphosphoribosylaminopyrimidine deaminase/5-amino-6-(5-phosphoribosylamino)uracil reductase RibD n=1 Tax=Amorphus coralli TaxID=340680 RepID=UPI000378AFAE|nr:bifunctional diaminohydroxyphosphoribosylaminopyrimidine deaminase/5-amino-6-(5-phosphoribosylamino)uracil reductase RibD [Amorphus coralli]
MTALSADEQAELDRRFMAAALALGRRNAGHTWPNPAVGTVIVRYDGRTPIVVARGWTAEGGRPHAEVRALAQAGQAARGATCYVSLEPCAHFGRTGPCSNALINAGVGRVVSAFDDPNPLVFGRGLARLEAAGIQVTSGVLTERARRDHAGHVRRMVDGRPHVRLKLAISADGAIGREGTGNLPISGPMAKARTYVLRTETDAVLIGVGTALADDPLLTCRIPGLEGRSPVRVVLDPTARLPLDSRLVRTAYEAPLWVVVGPDAPRERVNALAEAGATIVSRLIRPSGYLDLHDVLRGLADRGLTTVLVEGGARVARSFVEADLVDEAIVYRSKTVVGPGAVPALDGIDPETVFGQPAFAILDETLAGEDRVTHLWRAD